MQDLEREVRDVLDRWVEATVARDAQRYTDLFLRSPDPVVAWASGEVTRGWKLLFEHVQREFYAPKAVVQSVDVHDLSAVAVTDDAIEAVFRYDVVARDMWGTSALGKRLATMTFVRTKDGLRIAGAHFAAVAAPNG